MTTPVRLTRAQQREQTREALLDAAARVFVERGFLGSSVEAISTEAGFSRGAFYSNFASTENARNGAAEAGAASKPANTTSATASNRPRPRSIHDPLVLDGPRSRPV